MGGSRDAVRPGDHCAEPTQRTRLRGASCACEKQVSASKATVASVWVADVDVTDLLPLVNTPTIVLGAANEDPINGLVHALVLAERMPNARFVAYPGADIYFGLPHPRDRCPHRGVSDRCPARSGLRSCPDGSDDPTDIVASTDATRRARRSAVAHATRPARRAQYARTTRRLPRTARSAPPVTASSRRSTGPTGRCNAPRAVIERAGAIGIDVRAGTSTPRRMRRNLPAETSTRRHRRAHRCREYRATRRSRFEVFTTSTVKALVAGSGDRLH